MEIKMWNKGTPLEFSHDIDRFFVTELIRPKMKYLLVVFLSQGSLYYALRYWKGSETPWTKPAKISSQKFADNSDLQCFVSKRDGYLQGFVRRGTRVIQHFWINPDDVPEIKEIEGNNNPKLEIIDGELRYGNWNKFFGATLREVLPRAIGQGGDGNVGFDCFPDQTNMESYRDYIRKLKEYKFNLVRQNACSNPDLVRLNCIDMEQNGKVVILTMADYMGNLGNYKENFEATKDLTNVLYNAFNEFEVGNKSMSGEEQIALATEITCYIMDRGGLVSGGAYWQEDVGKVLSDEYLRRIKPHILSHHRPWDIDYMAELVKKGFIVAWDEFFRLTLGEVEDSMKLAHEVGVKIINYYPFRNWPTEIDNYFAVAEKMCIL